MPTDPNAETAAALILARSIAGIHEYGVDTTRPDYSLADWLDEAITEAADKLVYLIAARRTLEG